MLYFKDESGQVFAYDEGQVSAGYADDKKKMLDSEIKDHLESSKLPDTRKEIEARRLIAYAHPVTGCDKYKAEAYAERLSGNEEAAAIADQKLIARREEIRAENPWP